MATAAHWEEVYRTKDAKAVSWYRPHLDTSLVFIASCTLPLDASILDVGGGASTLVDDLLDRGYTRVTILDLASASLSLAKLRLGERGMLARWIVGDASERHVEEASVDLWHDRAVFHFLTDESRRAAYLEELARAVRPGGFAVIGTFALEGPERCSGLPVRRYDQALLAEVLRPSFEVLDGACDEHVTPWGSKQSFVYVRAVRRA
jgi:ubiquinone/menaquinone biosynthesis C-methylase UbiE